MPYPDSPADCPKLKAWKGGHSLQGNVGPCSECPHVADCAGEEISQMGKLVRSLKDLRETLGDTPVPLAHRKRGIG